MIRIKLIFFLFLLSSITKAQNIYTFAGNGVMGFSGDGGLAVLAQINSPEGIAADAVGNVYITESNGKRIRKVDASGTISTFAGTGISGFSGDGGPATSALISFPYGITTDAAGNIYFSDLGNSRIRKINTLGIISTIAGTGVPGFSVLRGRGENRAIDLLSRPDRRASNLFRVIFRPTNTIGC